MAWGSKDSLIALNASMKTQIELLREMIQDLRDEKAELATQLKHTQEALIAKESPEAYRDQKYAEDQEDVTEADRTRQHELMRRNSIQSEYLSSLEGDLFKDADDMQQLLTRVVETPGANHTSLHGNNES